MTQIFDDNKILSTKYFVVLAERMRFETLMTAMYRDFRRLVNVFQDMKKIILKLENSTATTWIS